MLQGDRGSRFTRKLTTGIIIAAIVLAAGVPFMVKGLIEVADYQWRSDQRRVEYANYAYAPAYDACLRLPPSVQSDCVAKTQQERRENERDEQDLVAQQTMSVWTAIMGAAAVIGMMLSAFGVFLVFTTFQETKRSADAAMKSYEAFIKFENATIDVKFVAPPSFVKEGVQWFAEFHLRVRNMGRSPALIEWVEMQGEPRETFQSIVGSGETCEFADKFRIAVPESGVALGCLCYTTTISRGTKRVFHIGTDKVGCGEGARATIHPGPLICEGDDGYENHFD